MARCFRFWPRHPSRALRVSCSLPHPRDVHFCSLARLQGRRNMAWSARKWRNYIRGREKGGCKSKRSPLSLSLSLELFEVLCSGRSGQTETWKERSTNLLSTGASFDIPFDPRTLSSIGTPGNRWRATAITFPPIEPTRASHFVSESTKAIFTAYSLEFNDIRPVELPKRHGSVLRFKNPLRTIVKGNSVIFLVISLDGYLF